MSDRERLEGLRTHLQNVKRWEQKTADGWKPSVLGEWRHDDVEWLIQQAERVAELEKRLDTEVESGYQMEGQMQDAKAENARLRKAKVGERILIVDEVTEKEDLNKSVYVVSDRKCSPGFVITEDGYIFRHSEYEVIAEDEPLERLKPNEIGKTGGVTMPTRVHPKPTAGERNNLDYAGPKGTPIPPRGMTIQDLQMCVSAMVQEERKRQNRMWGEQRHPNLVWLSILMEEVGEVAEAMQHGMPSEKPTDAADLLTELIQVAAVAQAAAEQVYEEMGGREH